MAAKKGGQKRRITYTYRTTLTLEVRDLEILLIDIGSLDEVYR